MVKRAWLMALLVAAVLIAVSFVAGVRIGRGPLPPPPTVYLTKDKVPEHGAVAYDKAVLNIGPAQTLVIPDSTKVDRGGAKGRVEVYLVRRTSIATSPPFTDSDALDRKILTKVGCVRRTEEGKLVIGTYGDNAGTEFATTAKLLITVSDGQRVETRPGLADEGWPATREPGVNGWEAVTTEVDPAQTAHRAE